MEEKKIKTNILSNLHDISTVSKELPRVYKYHHFEIPIRYNFITLMTFEQQPLCRPKSGRCTQVSISSMFYVQIFCTNVVSAAFSSCMYIVKAAEMTFIQKICT